MTISKKTVMIDCHGLWFRALAKAEDAPYWFFKTAFKFRDMYDADLYLVADNNDSGWKRRTNIFPDYKRDREHVNFEVLDRVLSLSLLLVDDVVGLYQKTGYEADDIVFNAVAETPKPIYVVSDDGDWDRLLGENVSRLKFTGEMVTVDSFQKKHGFTPTLESVSLYKAIRGDSSDNIPPAIPYLREKKVVEIVKCYKGDVIAALRHADVQATASQKRDLIRNFRLILPDPPDSDYFTPTSPGSVSALCMAWGWDVRRLGCRTKTGNFFGGL